MTATMILQSDSISVYDYRCTAGPDSKPFVEQHRCHSVAYVRKGSFGCVKRGQSFELVAGSILVGHPGDEYVCTHDHHICGDNACRSHLHRKWWTASAARPRSGAPVARRRCPN